MKATIKQTRSKVNSLILTKWFAKADCVFFLFDTDARKISE